MGEDDADTINRDQLRQRKAELEELIRVLEHKETEQRVKQQQLAEKYQIPDLRLPDPPHPEPSRNHVGLDSPLVSIPVNPLTRNENDQNRLCYTPDMRSPPLEEPLLLPRYVVDRVDHRRERCYTLE